MNPRKLIVTLIAALVLVVAGIVPISQWLVEHGWVATAQAIRSEYLTGTAIAVIVAMLIMLPGRIGRHPDQQRYDARHRWPFED